MPDFDLAVIGAGAAGLSVTAVAAQLGLRVALIERHKMGGDCLNFGCVPSKALISTSRLLQRMREAEAWGLEKTSRSLISRKSSPACGRDERSWRRSIRRNALSR